jgi:hypothetical protein
MTLPDWGAKEKIQMSAEDLPRKRYRLSYHGRFLGSYDTAAAALDWYESHETIRSILDHRNQGRYTIRDGNRSLTIRELRKAAGREGVRPRANS